MKNIVFGIICIFSSVMATNVFGQTKEQEAKLEKIESLLQQNKIEKGEKKLIALLEEYNNYGDAWDLYASIKYYHFDRASQTPNIFNNMSVTTISEEGDTISNDNTQAFVELLSKIIPSKRTYNDYLKTLRFALAHSQTAYKSSMNLRIELRENYSDTTLKEKEIMLFEQAEKEFGAKNFNKAAILYQEALDVNPNYYKALLYLGDSYYMMANYIDAIEKFENCISRFPDHLEPRKYLVDSYLNEGLYKDALQAAIETKLVYPDLFLNYRMLQAADNLGKQSLINPMERFVLPNKINKDSISIIPTEEPEIKFDVPDYWEHYTAALSKINDYCELNGIISKPTSLTESKYLEVFSWENMLKESNHADLETARDMQKLGYLDCYVLISCFHDDFYDQYIHFTTNNRKKIIDYYNNIVLKSVDY